jgi:mRNA interferase HicA
MNRADLIHHLEAHGCVLRREGKKHTIYHNPANGAFSTIP